jgi:pimeloyl-ACP methyl ester carboxylesterase
MLIYLVFVRRLKLTSHYTQKSQDKQDFFIQPAIYWLHMKRNHYLGLSEEGFHRIAYTEWGQPNSNHPPIICLHGMTRNGRDFDELAAYLSQHGRHVFCPDLVGRGDSDWLRFPLHYTYEQYLADMNTLIARIGTDEIDWIGTSLGGIVGMVLASLPKTPIKRLILNDIGPQISTKGIMRLADYVGKEPDFTSMDAATNYYKTIFADIGNLSEQQWRSIAESSVQEIAPGKFVSKTDHGVTIMPAKCKITWQAIMHPLKVLEGSLFDVDLWPVWRKVSCPTLLMHGEKSDILLPATVQKMQQIHPEMDVIEIADVGHAPSLLDVKQHEMIMQWLSRRPAT